MGEACTDVYLDIVSELVVPVLSGMMYIDRVIKSVHLAERKSVPYHFRTVPILFLHKAGIKTRINRLDYRRKATHHLGLLVTPTSCEPRYITASRQVVSREMCETSVLVFTMAEDLIKLIFHKSVDNNHDYMIAKHIFDVYLNRPFHITIAIFGKEDKNLFRHQRVGEGENALKEIFYIKENRFLYTFGGKETKHDSPVNVVHHKPVSGPWKQMAKHESYMEKHKVILKKDCRKEMQIPAKFKYHRPAILEMLEKSKTMWDGLLERNDVAKHRID